MEIKKEPSPAAMPADDTPLCRYQSFSIVRALKPTVKQLTVVRNFCYLSL